MAVVETGTAVSDAVFQRRHDRVMEPVYLCLAQASGGALRMDARAPQSLAGVDVAQARQEVLVEQQALEFAPPPLQGLLQPGDCERL